MNQKNNEFFACTPDNNIYETNLNRIHKYILNSKNNLYENIEDIEKYILNNPECLSEITCPSGWTPLMLAVMNVGIKASDDIIDFLLCYMPDINAIDNNGYTSLLLACKYINYIGINPIIRLIDSGASLYYKHKLYNNAFITICIHYNNQFINKENNKCNKTDLLIILKKILTHGIYIDDRDKFGKTALYYYCLKEKIYNPYLNHTDDIIKLFRLWGSNLTIKLIQNKTYY